MIDYLPLTVFLRSLPASTGEIELSFPQVARILDNSLPPSAFEHESWWTNDPAHPQAAACLDAGWQVCKVELKNKTVNLKKLYS